MAIVKPSLVVSQDGDTLDRILHREHGSTARLTAIIEANPAIVRDQPDELPAGLTVVVPPKTSLPHLAPRLYD